MNFFNPGSLMQEHLANRAKTEARLTWFLKRTENTVHWMDSISVFILFYFFFLLSCLIIM